MSASSYQRPKADGRFIDPKVVMAIKNLELRAKVVVDGFWNGLHRSPYHGFSVEFTEYRPYVPGDDPRYLDWRLAARTDRHYIRKFEDETNLRCTLLTDSSPSMRYSSGGTPKSEYAHTLAATFGYFLNQQGDAVGLITFDEGVRDYLPARNRPGHLRQLMLALEKPSEGAQTDVAGSLERAVEMIRKPGMIVVISDFLTPIKALERPLSHLTARGHELAMFRILDPAEIHFEFDREVEFEDVESRLRMHVDPSLARKSYLERFRAHEEALVALCDRLGVSFLRMATDDPLENALFFFLRGRMSRDRSLARSRARR